jgi:ribonuclease-3
VITPQQLQDIIGLQFNDSSLLLDALTHRSYANEAKDETVANSERLEYLGDAVLAFLSADYVFHQSPELAEGELTRMRASLVNASALAILANEISLGDALRMGKGVEKNGGRRNKNILSDGFEALLGAIYLDQGLDSVKAFLQPRLAALSSLMGDGIGDRDARSDLQARAQAERGFTPVYRVVDEAGLEHDRTYTVEVVVGEDIVGKGSGRSKQSAAMAAAQDALERWKQ